MNKIFRLISISFLFVIGAISLGFGQNILLNQSNISAIYSAGEPIIITAKFKSIEVDSAIIVKKKL